MLGMDSVVRATRDIEEGEIVDRSDIADIEGHCLDSPN